MLWRFRRELIEELMKDNEVVLRMPFVGHEKDFMDMGLKCIDTPVDRRGINPLKDLKLDRTYKKIISEEKKPLYNSVTLSHDTLKKYFPKSYTAKQMENIIIRLLDSWLKKRQQSQER